MKSVILFDFFGVICSEISVIWFGRHLDAGEVMKIKADFVGRGDLGELSEEEVYERLSALTGVAPDDIGREWRELVKIDRTLVEFIRKLKRSHPVYLLSNAIGSFLHEILRENDLYFLFDGLFISSEERVAKPSEDFFRGALDKFGIRAEDAVFIDDNPTNTKSARAVGIEAIDYKGTAQLEEDLRKHLTI